ncbi:hypothetical protein [Lysinibacillus sphaericus]|uniref:hypothetical protein n=1 Tax=Lysinibacillus sphaericus TaxID=1421 RepID=UPI003D7F6F7E
MSNPVEKFISGEEIVCIFLSIVCGQELLDSRLKQPNYENLVTPAYIYSEVKYSSVSFINTLLDFIDKWK